MISENDDVLILTDKDLCPLEQKICCGTTLKGKYCKNKVFENYDYCKIHYAKFRLEKPDECPVCMENLEHVHIPLSCSHWVHRDCIIKWGKDKCPVCRAEIKLTSTERKKLRKKIHKQIDDDDDDDHEIILPPQLLEFLDAIIRSFPEAIQDGFMLNVDIDDNSITLLNGNEDDIMFSSDEFT